MKLIDQFLAKKSIKDIEKRVKGELLEFATDDATYFYGNGELIIEPVDNTKDSITYVVDTYNGKKSLVEF